MFDLNFRGIYFQVKIGLWIDLTNTSRYYSKDNIVQQNCTYEKINCVGHGECPSRSEISRFISVVNNFIISSPHECIVVHCTHGFNRTGFMVVTFLVERLEYTVLEASQEFAQARYVDISYKSSWCLSH